MGRRAPPFHSDAPLLYDELAPWWPLVSDPADYEEEAGIFAATILEGARRPVRTVLELGSGGGNNASHLKKRFAMTLVDRSAPMLAASRALNPECEHAAGDMRTVRLGRRFDAVFVHDAVVYLTTESDLEAAMRTAFEHLEPDGVALFVPDYTAETFRPSTSHGGHDAGDRGVRYLEWQRASAPGAGAVRSTYVFVLREGEAERVVVDHHDLAVFPRATWLRLLERAGFEPRALPYRHSTFESPRELFLGVRPAKAEAAAGR